MWKTVVGSRHKLKHQRFFLNMRKYRLSKGFVVSILGDTQNLSACGSRQLDLDGSAWSRALDQMILWRSLPNSTAWWFLDWELQASFLPEMVASLEVKTPGAWGDNFPREREVQDIIISDQERTVCQALNFFLTKFLWTCTSGLAGIQSIEQWLRAD